MDTNERFTIEDHPVQMNAVSDGTLLRLDVYTCEQVYTPEVRLGDLYAHPYVEISLVASGCGVHRVAGQAIPCKAGDIYILNHNVPHRFFAAEEGEPPEIRRILFSPKDWFDEAAGRNHGEHYCYGVFTENNAMAYAMLTDETAEQVAWIYDAVSREFSDKPREWRGAVGAHLTLLLVLLGRYVNRAITRRANKSLSGTDALAWNPVSAILTVMAENYGDADMTLESMAETFYVSASRLSRLFVQVTGEPFTEYLRKVRMNEACVLLTETDLTVGEIMLRCGMRDAASFYGAFRKHTDMTPTQYRKNNKKGDTIMNAAILSEISENLQKGKAKIVAELVQKALDEGVAPDAILNEGLLSGMNVIGEKFKNNEVYVPEVLVAARAMNKGTTILKPHLAAAGVQATGKVCIGTVQGDLHDIGKNLVKMMLEGKGLEVVDLGTDVSPETFVQTAIDQNCQVICCSALLTTTMGVMEDVVKKAVELGVRDKVKIMIGGAPVNEDFCARIGADIYTPDAASAADIAVEFCKEV